MRELSLEYEAKQQQQQQQLPLPCSAFGGTLASALPASAGRAAAHAEERSRRILYQDSEAPPAGAPLPGLALLRLP